MTVSKDMGRVEVLPCPFCGGEAETDSQRSYRALHSGKLGRSVAVYCTKCSADMSFCCEDASGVDPDVLFADMVAAWNKRAVNAHDLVKALEEAQLFLNVGASYAPNTNESIKFVTGETFKSRGLADVMRAVAENAAATLSRIKT